MDRYDEGGMNTVMLEGVPRNINKKMDDCEEKDNNKKLEKKEDRLRQDKMKRLQAMSLNYTNKLGHEAPVLDFLCYILKLQPLLPGPEDLEMLDEETLVRIRWRSF